MSIFGWGGLGSGLSWLGVALICPQVRPIKWGLLCTIVGGIALNLVFLFNLAVEFSKATDLFTQITSGFSVWQGLVAAAIGFAWLRARSDSSASTDWLTALFQKLSVRFRPA